MIAMPLTGWLMSSASGAAVSFFGLFLLPNLVASDKTLKALFKSMHWWLAYSLMAMIALHVLAAFNHLIINKNNIVRRMLP